MLWWIIFVLSAILAYIKLYKPHQYWKERNVLHLKPKPIVGNLGNVIFRIKPNHINLVEQYNTFDARYYGTYVFLKPAFFVKEISLIKQLFVKAFDHFIDRNIVLTDESEPVFGRSLFLLRGQRWRDMRATLSPAFTSSKMRSMFNLITECAENLANHFEKTIQTNEIKSIEMKDATTRYANDVIASCAFGIKCDSLSEPNNEFYLMGKELSSFRGIRAIKIVLHLFIPKIMKFFKVRLFDDSVQDYFRNTVTQMMATREKEGIIRPDMIHLLMEAKKGNLKYEESLQNSDAGFATVEESTVGQKLQNKYILTDDDLTAQAVLFFAAGFDTSATLMSFMAYELALNEDVQRKLQDEIDLTMFENNNKLSYETILSMKYLDMVICETLRKWPPVPSLDRLCVKPYTIEPTEPNENPVLLEKGMVIFIAVYAMHHDPKYFPNPDRFDPERFNDENKRNIDPYTYLPFGIGPRNCIGSRFALLEAKAMIVYWLNKFDIVVVKETQIPLKIDKTSFNLQAEKGFWLGLKLREK